MLLLGGVSRQAGGQVLGVEAWRAWHTDLGCYGASAPRCAADIAEHPPREVMWSQFFHFLRPRRRGGRQVV